METKPFGWTGLRIPTIGQGTWRMGDNSERWEAERAAIRLGIELGMTHIDTAEMFAYGDAEEMLSGAIRDFRRENLFLVSKALPENARYKDMIRVAEESLHRLQTDYLDLYMLQWPSIHPIEETMGAMEDLVRQGKVRFIGMSNCRVAELEEAMAVLTRERIACNQIVYHIAQRLSEADVIPFCGEHQIAVVGYTPFGRISFPDLHRRGLGVLAAIGDRHGKTARQVALRFLTRDANVFTITKAARLEHVRENSQALDFELTAEDLAEIDIEFPPDAQPQRLELI
jgi:diketogulonate reductase-like aldo/keto reductase